MNRGAGTGLMAFGIVLVVVGAIMRFAVSAHASGFNIHKAGIILLFVGIGVFVVSLLHLRVRGEDPKHDTHGRPGNSLRPGADRATRRLGHVLGRDRPIPLTSTRGVRGCC